MRRNRMRLLVDIVLLASALATFGSGLVLFFRFHVGEGTFRDSALGITRLTWLNLHRLPALIVVAAVGLHLALNRRPFAARLRRAFARRRGSKGGAELILYVTFWTAAFTGLASLVFISGSPPFAGPAQLGPLPHCRHHVIDVHDIAGLVAVLLAVHHVGHRWRWMVRSLSSEREAASRARDQATECVQGEPIPRTTRG